MHPWVRCLFIRDLTEKCLSENSPCCPLTNFYLRLWNQQFILSVNCSSKPFYISLVVNIVEGTFRVWTWKSEVIVLLTYCCLTGFALCGSMRYIWCFLMNSFMFPGQPDCVNGEAEQPSAIPIQQVLPPIPSRPAPQRPNSMSPSDSTGSTEPAPEVFCHGNIHCLCFGIKWYCW